MEEKDVTKDVLSNLRGYLRDHLPVDVDFLSKLQSKRLLAKENADELRIAVETKGGKSGVDGLLHYMSSFYDEETLEEFCVFLEEYSQQARPLLSKIAKTIREDLKQYQPHPTQPAETQQDVPGPSGSNPEFNAKSFMDKYKERFLRCVHTPSIATRLKVDHVIPEVLYNEIDRGKITASEASEKLFLHLRSHAVPDTFHHLCDVMAGQEDYPLMKALGEDMKKDKDLPPSSTGPLPMESSTPHPSGTTRDDVLKPSVSSLSRKRSPPASPVPTEDRSLKKYSKKFEGTGPLPMESSTPHPSGTTWDDVLRPSGPPSSPPATQGEPTPTVSTMDERSQKIEEIVDMYRSGKVSLPEIPELEDDFDDIMGRLNAELSSADPKVICELQGMLGVKYRRYIQGETPGKVPSIPDTARGLYEFIAEKSTTYEILLIHHAVEVLNCEDLRRTLQNYESKLADHLRFTLESYKKRNMTLPFRKHHTHLAVVLPKEQVLLSLVLHIKRYLKKYLKLEEAVFEGFVVGSTVLFFSILQVDAVLLGPKVLSHSAELKRMFDITHLVVFDYFACDLERATIELPEKHECKMKELEASLEEAKQLKDQSVSTMMKERVKLMEAQKDAEMFKKSTVELGKRNNILEKQMSTLKGTLRKEHLDTIDEAVKGYHKMATLFEDLGLLEEKSELLIDERLHQSLVEKKKEMDSLLSSFQAKQKELEGDESLLEKDKLIAAHKEEVATLKAVLEEKDEDKPDPMFEVESLESEPLPKKPKLEPPDYPDIKPKLETADPNCESRSDVEVQDVPSHSAGSHRDVKGKGYQPHLTQPAESQQDVPGPSVSRPKRRKIQSGIPSASNEPPDEGNDGTSKISLENLDNLPQHSLTEEDLSLLQGHTVEEGDYVWMELGVTGAGKSCLGNFILQEDNRFPESEYILEAETQKASMGCTVFDKKRLCIVDTPGLGDTKRIGTHESKAMDIADDASHLIMELTKMMMLTRTGISAFFIVVPLHHRDYAGLQQLLDFFDILGNYWNHSIVVLTHGKAIGGTEDEQYKTFTERRSPILIDLVKKVNDRFVIVEAKDWRSDTAYRNGVITKLLSLSDDIFKQHGRYQDNLQSIGREAYERAKLQYRNEFEAKEAIFQSTFSYVRKAVLKLVRIKLADGEDVDKLKEMNELKEKMLEEIRKQRDQLHQEFLEEQKRRREAEEKQKRIEEERRKEEQRRKHAEEEQRKAEERRRVAEEQKLKEQREKEEAQRKLEEYLRKPTFNERRIEVDSPGGKVKGIKWKYSTKAVDVATGISARSGDRESKSGAKKHARDNLKAILLDRGIIRKDDI